MDVFRRFRAYYWKNRFAGFGMLLFALVTAGLGIAQPNLQRLIVDNVILAGNAHLLPWYALGIVAVAVCKGASLYLRRYLGHIFGSNSVFEVRNALYKRLQSLSFKYYDTVKTGDLMSRLAGDVEVFRQFLAFGFAGLLEVAFMFCFGLIAMLIINWRLTLMVLMFMPFLAVLTVRFHHIIHPHYTRVREAMADMSTAVQESITGVRTVKSFAREPQQIDSFSGKVAAFVHSNMNTVRILARFLPLMELIGSLTVLILIYFGGRLVINGDMSVGSLVAFFSLVWFIIEPVQSLGYEINNFTNSIAAGERLLEILDTPRDLRDAKNAVPLENIIGDVVFDNVSFNYSDEMPTLEHINLQVKSGTVVGVLGPTGSGKSTLVSLIPRYYDVNSGRVLIDGRDVREITLASLRRQVGIVFQDTFLFSTTIRENIGFARRDATTEEIMEAARLACAHEFIMGTPQGYETLVGERGMGLSGGQKQRIAIARAILADPRILILDDATASVDMETEHEIQQALQTLMAGRTTFIIAHRISSIKDADNIIVLDKGRVAEEGTHRELLARDGIYRRIYNVQFGDQASIMHQLEVG